MNRLRLGLFLFSCLSAFVAGHIVNYSIIFLSLELFNSHALAGLGYGLCFGPPIILGWFAGVYCDRYSPRVVILVAQNSFFLSLLSLYFALSISIEYQSALVLIAALFSGIAWSFVAPARFAALPFYTNPRHLAGAAILLNIMVMAGFGIAPVLLKQIQSVFGWREVFYFAAGLFALSSALLVPLKFRFKSRPSLTTFSDIKHSIGFINESKILKQLLILAVIAYLLMGPMQVLLPTITQENLSLSELGQGYYLSLVAISLFIGGVVAMLLKDQGFIGIRLMACIAMAGVGLCYISTEYTLAYSVAALFLAGICAGVAVSFIVAGLQAFSPNEHRGRVMSFYTIISQFVPAASGLGAGLLAQTFTPQLALKIMAIVIILSIGICFFALRKIRLLSQF